MPNDAMMGHSAEDQAILDSLHKKLNPQEQQPQQPVKGTQPAQGPRTNHQPLDQDLTPQPEQAQEAIQEEAQQPAEGQELEAVEAEGEIPVEAAPTIKVTIKDDDGKDQEVELPVDEVRSGYMRHADYTRKTQALAKERAAIPQKLAESERAVTEARTGFTQALQNLEAFVVYAAAPELGNVDWNRLAVENPGEHVRLTQRANQINATLTQIRNHQTELAKQAQEQHQKAMKQAALDAREALNREIPGGWNDDLYSKITKGAINHYGFTPEEFGTIVDARTILMANDALKYRELVSGKPIAQQKVAKAPLAVKPGAAPTPADKRQSLVEKARETARKSGSVEDALALMQAKRQRTQAR